MKDFGMDEKKAHENGVYTLGTGLITVGILFYWLDSAFGLGLVGVCCMAFGAFLVTARLLRKLSEA
jgi:hypothetical protein